MGGAELREHGRRTHRRAPSSKILGAVGTCAAPQVRIDVLRVERTPPGTLSVDEHALARGAQLPSDETHQGGIRDDLTLPHLSLSAINETRRSRRDAYVRLAER